MHSPPVPSARPYRAAPRPRWNVRRRCEEPRLVARQEFRPAMGGLGTRLIEVRCLRRCAARCRNTVERAGELRGKDNRAVFAPISSASAVGVADHYGCTTPHRNLLQFPFAEKTDPLAVRGKKRAAHRPRTVEQHGPDFIQFTHVKLPPARYAL